MQISARTDYGVRAMLCLAALAPEKISVVALAAEQDLPHRYLGTILADLRRAGLVRVQRGSGGYVLAVPAESITIGTIVRAIDGPLVQLRGMPPEETHYTGPARYLPLVWQAVDAALAAVYDETTLANVLIGDLPEAVRSAIAADAGVRTPVVRAVNGF